MQIRMGAAMILMAFVGATASAAAQEVIRGSCGSMAIAKWTWSDNRTDLNEGSTLERECIVLNVPEIPVKMHGPAGVEIRRDRGTDLVYAADYEFTAMEALVAVEIRFLVFDVWRESIKTLSATYIEDIGAGKRISKTAYWRTRGNEAEEHYASIGYVARARTEGGEILTMPIEHVLRVAREFAADFSEEDLELAE